MIPGSEGVATVCLMLEPVVRPDPLVPLDHRDAECVLRREVAESVVFATPASATTRSTPTDLKPFRRKSWTRSNVASAATAPPEALLPRTLRCPLFHGVGVILQTCSEPWSHRPVRSGGWWRPRLPPDRPASTVTPDHGLDIRLIGDHLGAALCLLNSTCLETFEPPHRRRERRRRRRVVHAEGLSACACSKATPTRQAPPPWPSRARPARSATGSPGRSPTSPELRSSSSGAGS